MAEKMSIVCRKKILGKEINFYGSIENPYFLPSEIAEWLETKNHRQMLKSAGLSDEQKGVFLIDSLGGEQETVMVNEDGLYDILMLSRKPLARPLKKEIKNYLKHIRLTGGTVEENREAEFVDKYFPSFTEETKLSMVQDLRKQNQHYLERIAELEPKAQAYIDLMTAQGYLQFIDVAAMVEIGRNKLFDFLRRCKVLTKQSNYNIPYGRFAKNGMFKVVTSTSEYGHISSVTMVSPKGLDYIYKLMKKKEVLDKFDTTTLLLKIQGLEVA